VANAGDCAAVIATASPSGGSAASTSESLSQLGISTRSKTTSAQGDKVKMRYRAGKLSTEHKADNPGEQKRIESMGGWVRAAEYDEDGMLLMAARLYRCKGEQNRRLGPGLAISRALGDLDAMRCGLSATPEVQSRTLLLPEVGQLAEEAATAGSLPLTIEHDAFLILASDGVWEFLEPQDAVDIVAPIYGRGGSASEASATLIKHAMAEWRANDGEEYRDDISATVVYLPALIAALDAGTLCSD